MTLNDLKNPGSEVAQEWIDLCTDAVHLDGSQEEYDSRMMVKSGTFIKHDKPPELYNCCSDISDVPSRRTFICSRRGPSA